MQFPCLGVPRTEESRRVLLEREVRRPIAFVVEPVFASGAHFARGLISPFRVPLEGPPEDSNDRVGNCGIAVEWRRHDAGHDIEQDGLGGLT